MNIELINYTPNPDMTVAIAAKQCYSPDSASDIRENICDTDQGKFIEKLFQMGHYSPFEHVSFTFAIDGVSRALTHQLVRHRIASYSQKSQRYVQENMFEYIVPKTVINDADSLTAYNHAMLKCQEAYDDLVKSGIPKEDARYVLPNACATSIVVTMNARSLFNFFNHRCCMRAQWEIRALAKLMLKEVKKVAPHIFKHAGSNCITLGYCPEGKMSCGLFPTLDQYKNNDVKKEDK